MAIDIVGYFTTPPLSYVLLFALLIYMSRKYWKIRQDSMSSGRQRLAKEIQLDFKQLSQIIGAKQKRTKIYQNLIEIGMISKLAIVSAIPVKTTKSYGKDGQKYTKEVQPSPEEIQKSRNRKILIAHVHKSDLWNRLLARFGYYNLFVIDSEALIGYERNEADFEAIQKALETGKPIDAKFRKFYIRQDVRLENHAGVTVVMTDESMDYMQSTIWKIVFENAQGEFADFTKQLTSLNAMLSGKVKIMETEAEIEENKFKSKVKRFK